VRKAVLKANSQTVALKRYASNVVSFYGRKHLAASIDPDGSFSLQPPWLIDREINMLRHSQHPRVIELLDVVPLQDVAGESVIFKFPSVALIPLSLPQGGESGSSYSRVWRTP
jgi:serine/threonine protein kinase